LRTACNRFETHFETILGEIADMSTAFSGLVWKYPYRFAPRGTWTCPNGCRRRSHPVVPPQTPDRDRLSQIEYDIRALPSLLAQLAYLAQLRDPNTGVYSHPGITDHTRTQEAHRVLERLHTQSFRRWLNLNLEGQKADFDLYVSGLQCSRPTVVRTWIQIESYRCFVPASASPPERELFFSDMDTLLHLQLVGANEGSPQPGHGSRRVADHDIMTMEEVAKWLHVAPRTLRHWAEVGEIPACRVGKLWRFRWKDLEEWLRGQAENKNTRRFRH
jgi:excisionase family DNA binding protein